MTSYLLIAKDRLAGALAGNASETQSSGGTAVRGRLLSRQSRCSRSFSDFSFDLVAVFIFALDYS